MGNSLQDQLLTLGLVDKKSYNKVKKKQHKRKIDPNSQKTEIAEMVKQGLAEKKKRDLQHNKKKRAERKAKEASAKARQLIETHRVNFGEGEIPYHFKHENRIKKIYLPENAVESLVKGKTGIVKLAGKFRFVPADIFHKVRGLNAKMVVLLNSSDGDVAANNEDDPYSDYKVPDDLMW